MSCVKAKESSHVERSVPGSESWISLHADHLARYFFAADYVVGRRVLDAGTGPGYGAAILKEAGALWVQAVDIEPAAIEQAREKYPIDGLEFLVDDCERFANINGPFDVICSFENIEHLHHPEKFVAESARLLSKDGLLLCSSPDREAEYTEWIHGKPNNPFHVNEWYYNEFRDLLSRSYQVVDIRVQVMSLSHRLRKQAVEDMNYHLTYLWSEPLLRLSRVMGRLWGRRKSFPSIQNLTAACPADYPIISRYVAHAIGVPHCLLAICRNPRR